MLDYEERIRELEAENEKLRKFKEYAHERLDDAGVSMDPESPHKAAECRVGGRLDELIARAGIK